ncbi:response regulator [Virgibacillus ihumii]|uniref:response regulator n=1 Tax=Virgibacillus ihumii TaxID=2686091 RepID=UPI00157DFC16|nr:response regulator [Virgibacillus ihumii]
MIKVLIVEDDPMVAEINKNYLGFVKGFSCEGIVQDTKEAESFLEKNQVDLILLDLFMPEKNGIELLMEIRKEDKSIDVIVISAASDIQSVKSALRLGSVDYLIKPFEFDRFNDALKKYKNEHEIIIRHDKFDQEELDEQLLHQNKFTIDSSTQLPKGLTKETLCSVVEGIFTEVKTKEKFSTETLAALVGISRVSMRKYLKFLADIEMVSVELDYKKTGRPTYTYNIKKENKNRIKPYLNSEVTF